MKKYVERLKEIAAAVANRVEEWAPSGPTGSARESIRKHLIAGGVIVLVLVFGVGGWASTTQIAGALIAQGSIVVDSNVKKVQQAKVSFFVGEASLFLIYFDEALNVDTAVLPSSLAALGRQ